MQLKRLLAGVCFALGGCGPEAGPDLSKHWVVGEYSDLDGTIREPADNLIVTRYTFREDGIVDVEKDASCGRLPDRMLKWQYSWEPTGDNDVAMEVAPELDPPPHPAAPTQYRITRDVDWEGAALTKVAASGPCKALGLQVAEVKGSLVLYHGHVCPESKTEPCEIAGEPETCTSCLRRWCDGEPPPCLSE